MHKRKLVLRTCVVEGSLWISPCWLCQCWGCIYILETCPPTPPNTVCFGSVLFFSCHHCTINFFFFVSRYLYTDPLHCNMTYLFLRLLKDDLKEYTCAAQLAGLSYGIASGKNAILVSMARQLTHLVWQGKDLGKLGGVLNWFSKSFAYVFVSA